VLIVGLKAYLFKKAMFSNRLPFIDLASTTTDGKLLRLMVPMTSAGLAVGNLARYKAIAPETCGAAIDVPDLVEGVPRCPSVTISPPGA
jgi:hypothetical protein